MVSSESFALPRAALLLTQELLQEAKSQTEMVQRKEFLLSLVACRPDVGEQQVKCNSNLECLALLYI